MSVIDVATKQVRPISVGRRIFAFEIAPDGRSLILYELSQEADIWLMAEE